MTSAPSRALRASVASALRTGGCVFAEEEARLLIAAAPGPAELANSVQQRVAGLPLEQILGWARFCGMRIAVDPGVFVPRRRTEFLVRTAVALAAPEGVAVDLCCGSGAVGAALLASIPTLEVYAVDNDRAAVPCARRNLPTAAGVFEGDLYSPLPASLARRVDVLAVNAPYVPSEEIRLMPPEARLHEPLATLDGGAEGLDIQRGVAAGAPFWLAPGGHLLLETSRRQATRTMDIVASSGLTARVVYSKKLDATVIIGTKVAPGEE
jgi:release factor glutamine methyltransferase